MIRIIIDKIKRGFVRLKRYFDTFNICLNNSILFNWSSILVFFKIVIDIFQLQEFKHHPLLNTLFEEPLWTLLTAFWLFLLGRHINFLNDREQKLEKLKSCLAFLVSSMFECLLLKQTLQPCIDEISEFIQKNNIILKDQNLDQKQQNILIEDWKRLKLVRTTFQEVREYEFSEKLSFVSEYKPKMIIAFAQKENSSKKLNDAISKRNLHITNSLEAKRDINFEQAIKDASFSHDIITKIIGSSEFNLIDDSLDDIRTSILCILQYVEKFFPSEIEQCENIALKSNNNLEDLMPPKDWKKGFVDQILR